MNTVLLTLTKLTRRSIQYGRSLIFALFAGLSMIATPLFAMGQRPGDPAAPPPPAWVQFFPFIVMILVFYFLLIRPQMRQRKEKERMITALKKGDRVVTTGGLIGVIMNINPATMDIKISDETKVKILKSAVLDIFNDSADTPQPTAIVSGN